MTKPQLYTFSQVANALGLTQANVNMWIKRGQMVPSIIDGKRMIDIENPTNKLWLRKQEDDNGRVFDLNGAFKKPSEVKKTVRKQKLKTEVITAPIDPESEKEVGELQNIQLEIKKAQLERAKKSIELDEIKIAKQLGQLLPTDAVKSFFLYTVETFAKLHIQETKTIAELTLSRFSATQEERIEVQKELNRKFQELKSDSVELVVKGLDQIVEEYQDTRGRGESK